MALIPPHYLDSVIVLGVPEQNATRWIATGFLFGKFKNQDSEGKKYTPYLVTNRHVFEKQTLMSARLDYEKGGTEEFKFSLKQNNKLLWTGHPDQNIDIAILPIRPDFLNEKKTKYSFFQSDDNVLNSKSALENGISEGDGIFLLGYPMGHIGKKQNYVLVREGNIARIRDCLQEGEKTFIANILNFPGNSGGPLITKPDVVAITGTKVYSKSSLLGVTSAYIPYQDIAISQQTGRPRIIFEENSGLAIAYTVDCILETIEEFEKKSKEAIKPILA
jgi:hypothetical protein